MTDAPTHLNGYPVVQATRTARGGHVILVDRGPDSPHRWVTAFLPMGMTTSWHWGHYLIDEADARADYAERCRRGF